MSLVTLDDVKRWLKIQLSDTSQDWILEKLRKSTETSVLNYCETTFELVDQDELVDGAVSDKIVPEEVPIHSVQELWFNVETDGSGGTQLETSSYYWDSEEISLKDRKTPRGRKLIRIVYKSGYDGLPEDVETVIYENIEAKKRVKDTKGRGVSSMSKEGESITFKNSMSAWDQKSGLLKESLGTLQTYRKYEIPSSPMATRND
jgi:hypothetical protein